VAASLLLKARELWRRNGEGDLWRPPFWPVSLAALFWPALLTALVGMVLFLGLRPGATSPQPRLPAPLAPVEPASSAAPAPPAAPAGSESSGGSIASPPSPSLSPSPPLPETATETPSDPVAPALPDPDPLLLALGEEGESDPLILMALADPGRSQLRLAIDPAFGALKADARQERAERWRVRSQELGFEHLDLHDGGGRVLGRSALVGSGMILLDPALPP
jgi:hypothetical protein